MPHSDNLYHYIAYGVILIAFFVVLKSPKKPKEQTKEADKKNNQED